MTTNNIIISCRAETVRDVEIFVKMLVRYCSAIRRTDILKRVTVDYPITGYHSPFCEFEFAESKDFVLRVVLSALNDTLDSHIMRETFRWCGKADNNGSRDDEPENDCRLYAELGGDEYEYTDYAFSISRGLDDRLDSNPVG